MAVFCEEYDLLFTHVPRTGGGFVDQMLLDHLEGTIVGRPHDSFRSLALARPPSARVFAMRDPLSWYRSYWAHAREVARKDSVWPSWDRGSSTHPTVELDRNCGYPQFERFVRAAIKHFPNGFVRTMYCDFLNGATHVLRTSHLHEDLESLLRVVSFDRPSLVRDRARLNEAPAPLKDRAVLSPETEHLLLEYDNVDGLAFPFVAD